MKLSYVIAAIATALLMAIGQLIFKIGASKLEYKRIVDLPFNVLKSPTLVSACLLYAVTIILWIWVLKHVPLNRAYPFTAISYIVTPIIAYFWLGESTSPMHLIGYVLIVSGILIIASGNPHNVTH